MREGMYRHTIDYENGIANFWTPELDPGEALVEFFKVASTCFGIRKSIGQVTVTATIQEDFISYKDQGATHLLSHNGDEIYFNAHKMNDHGEWVKVKSEFD